MEQSNEYTLRVDVYPIGANEGSKDLGLLQVHNYRFASFDDAFLHLYNIPVNCYDKKMALDMGERFFVDRAFISATGLSHPLMEIIKVNRSNTDRSREGIEAVSLDKGESHELLSPGLRTLFEMAKIPEINDSVMPIARTVAGTSILAPFMGTSRDVILDLRKPDVKAKHETPFSVEIRSNAYDTGLPVGVPKGTTVLDVFRYGDLGEALTSLITRTDLNLLDPVVSFNTGLGRAISSAELTDKLGGARLLSLLTVHYDDMIEVLPKAGAYLRFDGNIRRNLVELAVPQLSLLQMEPGAHIATIGHYNKEKNYIADTAGYKQLKTELSAIYHPEQKTIRHRERKGPNQNNHNRHQGPAK